LLLTDLKSAEVPASSSVLIPSRRSWSTGVEQRDGLGILRFLVTLVVHVGERRSSFNSCCFFFSVVSQRYQLIICCQLLVQSRTYELLFLR
jgi:hypothetical protein